MYTSQKQLYKKIMFENKWTLSQIDEMDVHFFFDVTEVEDFEETSNKESNYLSELW